MVQPAIDEFVRLLDLLARVNDAVYVPSISDAGERERLIDGAHNLANKFTSHALTILHLLDDTNVQVLPSFPPVKVIFVVSASIAVLTRTTMETFLVFHYVFCAPTKEEEKDYRYWCYKAAGVAERQNFPTITEEARQKLKDEKTELDELHGKLKSNAVFQNLTEKQKARFFEGKEPNWWRWNPDSKRFLGWDDIGIDAGFSKILASHMYSYLCGYTHSSSLSVLQTTQALENKETQLLIGIVIDIMNIVIANMIHEYCELFPRAQNVLKGSGANNLVETWIEIGRQVGENLGTGQDNEK